MTNVVFGSGDLETTLRHIVDKANEQKPFVLCMGYYKGKRSSGHAIVILGCEREEDGYHIIAYDENNIDQINYNYFTIYEDFSGFICNGDNFDSNTYKYLQVLNLEAMKGTPVLALGIKNIDNFKIYGTMNDFSNASGSAENKNKDDNVEISFNSNSSFRLINTNGEQLEYNNGEFSGDIKVLSIHAVIDNEEPVYTIEIPSDTEYVFENINSDIDVEIVTEEDFYAVKSEKVDSFTVEPGKGIDLNGSDFDFTAHIGVEDNGEIGIISVSANSEKDVSIDVSSEKVSFESEGDFDDVSVLSSMGIDKAEKKYDTVNESFSVNNEDATITPKNVPEPIYIGTLGDVDNDQLITANDALMILRASVGLSKLTSDQTILADIDNDGTITSGDALAVLRCSVGLSGNDKIGKPIAA